MVDVTPRKRVLVLVNPVGGKGKARSIVKETVLPILEAAGCTVTMMGKLVFSSQDVKLTNQRHNTIIMPNSWQRTWRWISSMFSLPVMSIKLILSVIACVGGDGTFYEVLNGLANRPDAKKALRIPLAPIPTGKLLRLGLS